MNNEKVDIELAYLAGLFEGEGSAIIMKTVVDNCVGYRMDPVIAVSMTDFEPVNAFKERWGGSFCKVLRPNGNAQPVYQWRVSNTRTIEIARSMMPYIKSGRKRGALQCIIDFCKTVPKKKPYPRLNPEVLRYRDELYKRCKAYNQCGKYACNKTEIELSRIVAIKIVQEQLEFLNV